MGAFVVLVFPAAFIQALGERGTWSRAYAWVGIMALVFSLVETQSRGPLLAFCITLLAIVLMPGGGVSRWRRVGFLAVFAFAFTMFMPGFYHRASERFGLIDKETSVAEVSRKSVWRYTWRIIADHPFGGIGFGERHYVRVMEAYGFREEYRSASLDNPHNSYLQAAVYAGLPALAVLLLANAALLLRARRTLRRAGPHSPIMFGLSVGLAGFLAVIYPDMHLFTQTVAPVYWVFFALLLALVASAPEEAAA
jgi:O-antigen ligase